MSLTARDKSDKGETVEWIRSQPGMGSSVVNATRASTVEVPII